MATMRTRNKRDNRAKGVTAGYPGGKSGLGVYHRIINEIPPHDIYLEPFLGAGSIMYYKRPAIRDVGVDINGGVVRDARKYLTQGELMVGDGVDLLQRLLAEHTERELNSQRKGVRLKASAITKKVWGGMDPVASLGDSAEKVVIYADPPYFLPSRRSAAKIYSAEASDQTFDGCDESWHVRLLKVLNALPYRVLLSGYASDLYLSRLKAPKWREVTYQTMTHGGLVTEYLWCNFEKPDELHDYRYLGDNRRERERIKRMQSRWKVKFKAMPALERYAILGALHDAVASTKQPKETN